MNDRSPSGLKIAQTLIDVEKVLRPIALRQEDLEAFFVDAEAVRSENRGFREALFSCLDCADNAKVLMYGHRGAGKSTEITKFCQEHAEDFEIVSFSILEQAGLADASVDAVLVLIAESLVKKAQCDFATELNPNTIQTVRDWFTENLEITESKLAVDGGAGIKLGAESGLVGSLLSSLSGILASVKADIRVSGGVAVKKSTKKEKLLRELKEMLNLLLGELKISLKKRSPGKRLLIVVEDLDKLTLKAGDDVFVQNPGPLADIQCYAIYTAPIWLASNLQAQHLESLFGKVTLPMIKVREADGTICEPGRATMREIVDRRVDCARLIDPPALELAIEKTGGVIRHLFDVLSNAAGSARTAVKRKRRQTELILREDVEYGLNQKKIDLVRLLGTVGLPQHFLVENSQPKTEIAMMEKLKELAGRPQFMRSDQATLLLLSAQAILEYNGKNWHAVHPLVEDYLRDVGELQPLAEPSGLPRK